LLALSIALPMALFAGAAWYDRQSELDRAQDYVTMTTSTLAEHAQAVIETVDLVLARVADHVGEQSWEEVRASRPLHDFLAGLREGLPQVESVFLVDRGGFIAASSRNFPTPAFDARDREYFKDARARSGLFVSAPFRGATEGTLAFTVSRPLIRNGSFDGVVAVTVYPGYFQGFYRAVLQRPGVSTAALLRTTDGVVLLRYPDDQRTPVQVSPAAPLYAGIKAGGRGFYEGRSTLDGVMRFGGYATLERVPLLVHYGLNRNFVLEAWYRHLVIFAAFAVLGGVALFLTARQVLAQTRSEQEHLRLLLAETERRQTAEARLQQAQKMEALGRLTGGVAHDFNNLLAAILGAVELAAKRVSDERITRLLAVVTEAAQRGARLTGQMLAFSRKRDIALRPVDANEVLRGMEELLSRTIGGLIRIHYDLAAQAWPVIADPVQLEVAVLNLAVNARDAMPLGGDLILSTKNLRASEMPAAGELAPGDYVALAVTDTGEGMSDEISRNAFEPFFTTKGPGKGTGLGLSMVFGFAQQAGGSAVIDSAPGRGTTVTLLLQRALVLPATADADTETARMAGRPSRILLVDDDDKVRELAREMLQEDGHTVTAAASGREALALLAGAQPFDLLLADYAMPGMTGSMLGSEAQALRPALPILFMTGYVDADALQGWSTRGYRTLNKPFTAKELEAAVQASIRHPPERNVMAFPDR
jgi:signal transduction histidine kinase/CheY-like chemotaxis protein